MFRKCGLTQLLGKREIWDLSFQQSLLVCLYTMKEFLKDRLKHLIVECLDLDDVEVSTIEDDAPIFGEGLGLDSIDALELVIQVEKQYGVKIKSSEETKKALSSVNVLADYILERSPERVAEEQAKAAQS